MSWRATTPSIAQREVAALIAQGAVVIDVREGFERRSGYIRGAIHVHPSSFDKKRSSLSERSSPSVEPDIDLRSPLDDFGGLASMREASPEG